MTVARVVGTGALLAALTGAGAAWAEDVVVPGAAGQQALFVRVGASGIAARACASGACTAEGAKAIEVAGDVKALLAAAKARVVALENGRSIVRVDAPAGDGVTWTMLLAGPPVGEAEAPIVFWSGKVGAPVGEHGEERTAVVAEERLARGVRVVLGQRRQDVTICGRGAVTNAHVLDPATLRFERGGATKDAGLGAAERAKAIKLTATRVDGPPKARPIRLLAPRAASSSADPRGGTLTDGDLETSWSEGKSGDGKGEFVPFAAGSDVPISALEIAIRPTVDLPGGAAPRTFFVATDDKVFAVTMPEDAWRKPPRGRYAITFPEAVKTSCVAVVLDEAHARGPDARVTLTEVTAVTPFDALEPKALVAALAGGGDRARGAGTMLERGGKAAEKAAIEGYLALDDAGRELARRVIDQADCPDKVPFYAARFGATSAAGRGKDAAPGELNPEFSHARSRLRGSCKNESAKALVQLLGDADEKTRLAAAEELPLLAPATAVRAILDVLATAGPAARAGMRGALAAAARRESARGAVGQELAADRFAARPVAVRVGLLRAIGPAIATADNGRAAFASLAVPGAAFETRYHLQAPAAELAKVADPHATAFLKASFADADPHVRRRAAEVSGKVPAVRAELVAAVDDREVRVREAAIGALAASEAAGAATGALVRRLARDDWPFVRAAAAQAMAGLAPDGDVDAALGAATEDRAVDVRLRALDAIGARRAVTQVEPVRDRAGADGSLDVRAHAIAALGALCDRDSVGALTSIALRGKNPYDELGQRLAPAALHALADIHPDDLAARLEPMLAKDASPVMRGAAKAAIAGQGRCK